MPKREKFEENSYLHVYNRGRYKQTLFHSYRDFEVFLGYIETYKNKCKEDLTVLAYSILPNHFHFVIHNKKQGHKLSYFIGNVCASYTRYYKAKYNTDKGIKFFESRFNTKIIEDDDYLQQCIQYVEFNAVKHELVEDINNRNFTSYDKDNPKTISSKTILTKDWEFDNRTRVQNTK